MMNLGPGWGAVALAAALMIGPAAAAQVPAPARPAPPAALPASPPLTAQKAALLDLTGYWVAVVDQDWRWRMITPAKGDYQGVPLNAAGRKIADEFDPAPYGGATAIAPGATRNAGGLQQLPPTPIGRYQVSGIIDCRAYGAPALMHMPTRLHISWDNSNTLRIETDWGEQTRLLHFIPNHPYAQAQLPLLIQVQAARTNSGPPSMQGHSVALWEQPYDLNAQAFQRGRVGRRGGAGLGGAEQKASQPGGDLAVVTTDLAPGWLRRNGVPYGSQTRVIEHYQAFQDPTGAKWFDVATEVIDPQYLTAPFFTTGDFQQEPDGSKWAPHACKQVAPEG
jgi:hypothetical protein